MSQRTLMVVSTDFFKYVVARESATREFSLIFEKKNIAVTTHFKGNMPLNDDFLGSFLTVQNAGVEGGYRTGSPKTSQTLGFVLYKSGFFT